MSNDLQARTLAMIDSKAAAFIASAAPWPPLDPLPALVTPEPAAFPFDALGPILGPAARVIADCVQAPDALAGGGVLAAAAVAAQPHINVVMPHGQEVPVSLFIAAAADSGARKSAVDAITCYPIDERRKADARAASRALAEYKAEKAKRKPGDAPDEPPPVKALTIGKSTVEGLHHLLRTQSHIGLFSPEGAEFVAGHSMRDEKRAAGIAAILKPWGGEAWDSMTKGDGLSVLVGRRVSMHLLMQPVILQQLMGDPLAQGQGWIARTLIAAPKSLAGTRMYRPGQVPATKRAEVLAYYAAVRALLDMPLPLHPDGDGYELQPRPVTMSDDAQALWVEFYDEAERQQGKGGALASATAWASKAAEHAARIAAVVAIMGDRDAIEVCADDMMGGIAVADFYMGEHVRLMGQLADHHRLKLLHDLLQWLRDRGAKVRRGEVQQFTPRHLRDLKAEGLNPLLADLQKRGYIRPQGDAWEVRHA